MDNLTAEHEIFIDETPEERKKRLRKEREAQRRIERRVAFEKLLDAQIKRMKELEALPDKVAESKKIVEEINEGFRPLTTKKPKNKYPFLPGESAKDRKNRLAREARKRLKEFTEELKKGANTEPDEKKEELGREKEDKKYGEPIAKKEKKLKEKMADLKVRDKKVEKEVEELVQSNRRMKGIPEGEINPEIELKEKEPDPLVESLKEQLGAAYSPEDFGSFHENNKTSPNYRNLIEKLNNYNNLSQKEKDKMDDRMEVARRRYPNAEPREVLKQKLVLIGLPPPLPPKDPSKPPPKRRRRRAEPETRSLSPPKPKEPEPPALDKIMKPPFLAIVCARKFSGKSSLLLNIVNKDDFDEVIIITKTKHKNNLDELCDNPEECIFDDLSNDAIRELLEAGKEGSNILLVLDDFIGISTSGKYWDLLASSGRNFNLSIIVSTQDIVKIRPIWRRNAEYLFLGSMMMSNINNISKEFAIPSMPERLIKDNLIQIAREFSAHNWLFYDSRNSRFEIIKGNRIKKIVK